MTIMRPPSAADLAPLLSAKGRIPLLPRPHVPRPRLVAALAALVGAHRLTVLSAGAFAGKTTLLAEFARSGAFGRVAWYAVDDVDETGRVMLEGLALAVGASPSGDETHLLARVVGALDAAAGPSVLIMDGVHRSAASAPVVERLLRYLPAGARLLLSGHPQGAPRPSLYHWLEDRG